MQRDEDIPSPYNASHIIQEVALQQAKGNNIFKKTTGKKSDYWIFVNREGRGIFHNTHKRPFDCKDKGDSQLMGQIWNDLPAEKRERYKLETQRQNTSEMVTPNRFPYRCIDRNSGQSSSYASLQNDRHYSASPLPEKRDLSTEGYRSRQPSAQQYRREENYRYSSPQLAQYEQYGRPMQDVQNSRYSSTFQAFQERQPRYQQEDQRGYSSPQRQQELRYPQDDRYVQGRDENRYPPGKTENRYLQGYSSSQNGQQQRYYQEEPRHRQRQPEPRYSDRLGSNIPPPPSYDEAIGDSISRAAFESSGRASQNSRMGGARATPQFEEMTISIASSSALPSTSKEQNNPKLTFKTLSKREFYDFESEKQRILETKRRNEEERNEVHFSSYLI